MINTSRISDFQERIVAHDARIASQEEHIALLDLAGRNEIASAARDRLVQMKETAKIMQQRLDITKEIEAARDSRRS